MQILKNNNQQVKKPIKLANNTLFYEKNNFITRHFYDTTHTYQRTK